MAAGALSLGVVTIFLVAAPSARSTASPRFAVPARELRSVAGLGPMRVARPGSLGPEDVPVPAGGDLAPADEGAGTGAVDGIRCLGGESLAFHTHAHLAIFVDGRPRRVPYGVGIRDPQVASTPAGAFVEAGSCFYWLHTHSADGVIHVESPVVRRYTLGDFFDVWGQTLAGQRVGPAHGHVTAFYDGRLFMGDPREMPLAAQAQIQLDVGRPLVAPVPIQFSPGL